MSVSEQMPLAEVKNRLPEVVDRLEREHGRVVITKHAHPGAVDISVEDLESLDFAIAWTAPGRRVLARLPEKAATAAGEFLYGHWPPIPAASASRSSSGSARCTPPGAATTG